MSQDRRLATRKPRIPNETHCMFENMVDMHMTLIAQMQCIEYYTYMSL
jgi:hypothetical protein